MSSGEWYFENVFSHFTIFNWKRKLLEMEITKIAYLGETDVILQCFSDF